MTRKQHEASKRRLKRRRSRRKMLQRRGGGWRRGRGRRQWRRDRPWRQRRAAAQLPQEQAALVVGHVAHDGVRVGVAVAVGAEGAAEEGRGADRAEVALLAELLAVCHEREELATEDGVDGAA